MKNWWIYIKERLSIPGQVAMALGIALSSWALSGQAFFVLPLMASIFGLILIFSYLRLKNDCDDIEKDRIAYKDRPLPRKVLTIHEARAVLSYFWAVLIGYAFVLAFLLQGASALMFALVLGYLWLWNRDFYAKKWLEKNPFIENVMKQETVILLVFFSVSCHSGRHIFTSEIVFYALVLFGAFLSYDICRKLDPFAHPIVQSYVQIYGFKITFLLACCALFVSCLGAFDLGVGWVLVPFQAALIVALLLLFVQPRQFKMAEKIALVSLFVHSYSGLFTLGFLRH